VGKIPIKTKPEFYQKSTLSGTHWSPIFCEPAQALAIEKTGDFGRENEARLEAGRCVVRGRRMNSCRVIIAAREE
jgi:hypothetical protein